MRSPRATTPARSVRTTPPADAVTSALRAGSFATTTPLHEAAVAADPGVGAASDAATTAARITPLIACLFIARPPFVACPSKCSKGGGPKRAKSLRCTCYGPADPGGHRPKEACMAWHVKGTYF